MSQNPGCSFPLDINPVKPQMPPVMSHHFAPPPIRPLSCNVPAGPSASYRGSVLGRLGFSEADSHYILEILPSRRTMLHNLSINDLHLWWEFPGRESCGCHAHRQSSEGCCTWVNGLSHPEILNTLLPQGPTLSF